MEIRTLIILTKIVNRAPTIFPSHTFRLLVPFSLSVLILDASIISVPLFPSPPFFRCTNSSLALSNLSLHLYLPLHLLVFLSLSVCPFFRVHAAPCTCRRAYVHRVSVRDTFRVVTLWGNLRGFPVYTLKFRQISLSAHSCRLVPLLMYLKVYETAVLQMWSARRACGLACVLASPLFYRTVIYRI